MRSYDWKKARLNAEITTMKQLEFGIDVDPYTLSMDTKTFADDGELR